MKPDHYLYVTWLTDRQTGKCQVRDNLLSRAKPYRWCKFLFTFNRLFIYEVEQGLTSHLTHYRLYREQVFMGQMTQPTVSKH